VGEGGVEGGRERGSRDVKEKGEGIGKEQDRGEGEEPVSVKERGRVEKDRKEGWGGGGMG